MMRNGGKRLQAKKAKETPARKLRRIWFLADEFPEGGFPENSAAGDSSANSLIVFVASRRRFFLASALSPLTSILTGASESRKGTAAAMRSTFGAAFHNEVSKFVRQKFPYLGMAAVILLAVFWVRGIRQMAGPAVEMNAFTMVIKGAISAITSLIPLFGAIFALVLVASETDSGTYRNVLSRPIHRTTFLTAKILFAFSYTLLLVVLFVAVAVLVTLTARPFGPILDNGAVVYSLGRMIGVCAAAFLLTLVPLFAIVSFGILVSTASRSLTGALGIGIGTLIMIDPIKYLVRWGNWKFSDYVLTTYLDTALNVADQAASGFDYEWLPRGWWLSDLGWGLTLSGLGIVIFLGASYVIFLRRDLNFS